VHVTIRHLLEPAGAGTLVLVEAEADAGKLLGLGGPLLRRAAERRARGDFARLKAVLEAPPRGGTA
jgi:carbon monoxide dehydrogenase subunit G